MESAFVVQRYRKLNLRMEIGISFDSLQIGRK